MMGYKTRTCYLNFAEHLQNSWNVNFMYDDAPGKWGDEEWDAFFCELAAFGFTNFQFWIPPTMAKASEKRDGYADALLRVVHSCHKNGLTVNPMLAVNTIGAEWYFACPSDPVDREKILEFWRFYGEHLKEADIFTIFPGDPGGCNRRGCNHNTFIALAAEIAHMLKEQNPARVVEVGTWGTPFTGWGSDMRLTPDWDGTWSMLIDPSANDPGIPCHIWNGTGERAVTSMKDLVRALPKFPSDTVFSVNSGFNPDAKPIGDFDGRPWAKEISQTHRVHSWDYAASEGELICYPHYRAEKYKRQRNIEMQAAPYSGAICYTMSPKLNQLMLYTAAHIMMDPDADTAVITADFTEQVFGDRAIGPLMEAFEIVHGWGYEGTRFERQELCSMLTEVVERLKASRGKPSTLPIFPSVDEYREDLIWHAENFLVMLGEGCDREAMRKSYYDRALSIYDTIPLAVDERSALSAQGYSHIGEEL